MSKIVSNFTKGPQGWTVTGDVFSFGWLDSGGSPGGYLGWVDAAAGSNVYFQASDRFHGDLGVYAGGQLSFEWRTTGAQPQLRLPDVLITGANGVTLYADVTDPGRDWTAATLTLSPNFALRVGAPDGPVATAADIAGVLHDVTALQIRAEQSYGPEAGGLDSVKLVSAGAGADPVAASAFGADRHTLPLAEPGYAHPVLGEHHVALA
jgi:hypothetical protein